MGGAESAPENMGWRILEVMANSPCSDCHIIPYFEYIVGINGMRLDTSSETFWELIQNSENNETILTLFNYKTHIKRNISVIPNSEWGGEGLLGLVIVLSDFTKADEQCIRVLKVHPNSPAKAANLQEKTDYLVGTPIEPFNDFGKFKDIIEEYCNSHLPIWVYNSQTAQIRLTEIIPTPNWGGTGILGCEVGDGYLHHIPSLTETQTQVSLRSYGIDTTDPLKSLPKQTNENDNEQQGQAQGQGQEQEQDEQVNMAKTQEGKMNKSSLLRKDEMNNSTQGYREYSQGHGNEMQSQTRQTQQTQQRIEASQHQCHDGHHDHQQQQQQHKQEKQELERRQGQAQGGQMMHQDAYGQPAAAPQTASRVTGYGIMQSGQNKLHESLLGGAQPIVSPLSSRSQSYEMVYGAKTNDVESLPSSKAINQQNIHITGKYGNNSNNNNNNNNGQSYNNYSSKNGNYLDENDENDDNNDSLEDENYENENGEYYGDYENVGNENEMNQDQYDENDENDENDQYDDQAPMTRLPDTNENSAKMEYMRQQYYDESQPQSYYRYPQ